MGLDMYLYASKYVSGSKYTRDEEGNLSINDNPEIDEVIDVVGLSREDLDEDYPSAGISVKILQWRKANAIHQWFVDNVQDGEDDCKEYYVGRDNLESLLETLGEVIKAKEAGEADESTLEDILPTASGFFFGGTEYDDYYWSEVHRTYEALKKILSNPKFNNFDFEYTSSW